MPHPFREIAEQLWHQETGLERPPYWNVDARAIELAERAIVVAVKAGRTFSWLRPIRTDEQLAQEMKKILAADKSA